MFFRLWVHFIITDSITNIRKCTIVQAICAPSFYDGLPFCIAIIAYGVSCFALIGCWLIIDNCQVMVQLLTMKCYVFLDTIVCRSA